VSCLCRHLFELKWVERELSRVCSVYQQTRSLHNRLTRKQQSTARYAWLVLPWV